MLCSRCEKNEASIYYKQILNNKVTEFHLCSECAKPEAVAGASPVFDLLASLEGAKDTPERRLQKLQCPACGLRYVEFRESGYLGCPACYESFAEPLKDILKHIHGATRHSGKAPLCARRRGPGPEEVAALKKALEEAVHDEKFETASRLRDRLKALEG